MHRYRISPESHKLFVALAAAAVIAAALFYRTVDPSSAAWVPQCMFHRLTGLDCPGCGSQRMLHALMHGDLEGAWHANAMLLCMAPWLLLLLAAQCWPRRWPRLHRWLNSVPAVTAAAVLITAWGIGRNLL